MIKYNGQTYKPSGIATIKHNGVTYYRSSRLPSGYTELEYIQSSGTQYINTNIYSRQITEADVRLNLSNTNNYTGFGDSSTNTVQGYPASMWCEGSGIKWYYSAGSPITLGTRDTDITATLPFPTQDDGNTVHIFHANGVPTGWSASGRFYFCRLKNGANLVFDGIPARRTSDSVLGMYDLVSNTFFTNVGTGEFTAGPDVN